MLRAPRESRARAVFSLVSPAPMTITSRSLEPAEDLLGQFHRHRADGDAAALDVGFGADVLGDVKRALEGLVQPAAGVAVLERQVVGLLELAEDFGFAQHHRVQAAGDLEEMVHALRLAQA